VLFRSKKVSMAPRNTCDLGTLRWLATASILAIVSS
jgi:hypothetical protein